MKEGTPYVILDGKIVSSDRCREKTVSPKGRDIDPWYSGKKIDLWYSGKKKDFGGNIQGLFRPDGLPAWRQAVRADDKVKALKAAGAAAARH